METIDTAKLLKKVKDRENELSDRRKRQDTDADIAKRKKYTLTDDKGKDIPRSESITLPKGAIFANRANNLLSSANPQTIVEMVKPDDKKTSKIEEFSDDIYLAIDEYLNERGMINLFPFQCFHANIRGGVAARIYLRKEEDKMVPDVVPWDTRYVASELEGGGKGWASYLTTRTKAEIEKDYGEETKGKTINEKGGKIRDVWTPEEEIVFLDETHLTSIKNPWGSVPVVEQLSPAGLHFLDEDQIKNSGESIFWLDRDLYAWANKCASIIASMNMEALFPPYQREVGNVKAEKPPKYPGEARSVTDTIAELKLVPKRDLMNSTRTFWAIIDSHIQQGSFSTIEFGTLQFPLSAVALEDLAEGRHLVLLPGLQTLAMFYRQATRMIIKQFIKLNESASFGATGKEKEYKPGDFEGDYSISYKYFQHSKRDLLAKMSEARASLPLPLSDHYRLTNILEVENPQGELDKKDAEDAKKMDPVLLFYSQVHALIDQDRQIEAQIVFRKLKRLLRGQDVVPQVAEERKGPAGELGPPLLGADRGGGGMQRQSPEIEGESGLQEAEREVAG